MFEMFTLVMDACVQTNNHCCDYLCVYSQAPVFIQAELSGQHLVPVCIWTTKHMDEM
jgi:hypothetical protein